MICQYVLIYARNSAQTIYAMFHPVNLIDFCKYLLSIIWCRPHFSTKTEETGQRESSESYMWILFFTLCELGKIMGSTTRNELFKSWPNNATVPACIHNSCIHNKFIPPTWFPFIPHTSCIFMWQLFFSQMKKNTLNNELGAQTEAKPH